jgi:hypothetical protein
MFPFAHMFDSSCTNTPAAVDGDLPSLRSSFARLVADLSGIVIIPPGMVIDIVANTLGLIGCRSSQKR